MMKQYVYIIRYFAFYITLHSDVALETLGRVAQWLKFKLPRLEQRGAGSILGLCVSFWSESARRPGG
jgi:hypothetical protein